MLPSARPRRKREPWVYPLLMLVLIAAASLLPQSTRADTPPQDIPFVNRQVITDTGTYNYEVFVPVHWDKKKIWPVILFLHGIGERGDDNVAQTKNGIRLLIGQNMDKFPCLVVCPQCRDNMLWTSPEMEEMALKALDQTVAEFNGNPNRLYLTGLSMGGYGAWDLAEKYPAKWAAVAPVCGGVVWPQSIQPTNTPPSLPSSAAPAPPSGTIDSGPVLSNGTTPPSTPLPPLPVNAAPPDNANPPAQQGDPYYMAAEKVSRIPVWDFHGEADPVVPVTESRQMVALLLSMGDDVRYTEYAGVGHDCWDYAYKDPNLLGWFLSHKLR